MLYNMNERSHSRYILEKLCQALECTKSGAVMAITIINDTYHKCDLRNKFDYSKNLILNWIKEFAPQLFTVDRAFSDLNSIPDHMDQITTGIHYDTFVKISNKFTGEFNFEKNVYGKEHRQKINALFFIRRELNSEIKTIQRFEEVILYYVNHSDDGVDGFYKEIKDIILGKIQRTNQGVLHSNKQDIVKQFQNIRYFNQSKITSDQIEKSVQKEIIDNFLRLGDEDNEYKMSKTDLRMFIFEQEAFPSKIQEDLIRDIIQDFQDEEGIIEPSKGNGKGKKKKNKKNKNKNKGFLATGWNWIKSQFSTQKKKVPDALINFIAKITKDVVENINSIFDEKSFLNSILNDWFKNPPTEYKYQKNFKSAEEDLYEFLKNLENNKLRIDHMLQLKEFNIHQLRQGLERI